VKKGKKKKPRAGKKEGKINRWKKKKGGGEKGFQERSIDDVLTPTTFRKEPQCAGPRGNGEIRGEVRTTGNQQNGKNDYFCGEICGVHSLVRNTTEVQREMCGGGGEGDQKRGFGIKLSGANKPYHMRVWGEAESSIFVEKGYLLFFLEDKSNTGKRSK